MLEQFNFRIIKCKNKKSSQEDKREGSFLSFIREIKMIKNVVILALVLALFGAYVLGQRSSEPALLESPSTAIDIKNEQSKSSVLTDNTQADSTVETHHKETAQSHKPADIKKELCDELSPENQCILIPGLDIQEHIFDKNTGNAKAQQISWVLRANDFPTFLEKLSLNKNKPESYIAEQKLNESLYSNQANYPGINSSDIACSDSICAFSVTYSEDESWNGFSKDFFSADNSLIGNLFIQQLMQENGQYESRVMFLPGNTQGVIR
ncbi:hypothetical protein [Pseudoalteromonas sp. T1lg76]|uniref:hypothetical protein n=2 Tax=unclassified Pseudoalteromonas TaxID=194690 RepID=UPI001319D16A|nr:hypothetical protein [Pseudoalteromonas sp. T1lg76]